jgi:hypothetical protein
MIPYLPSTRVNKEAGKSVKWLSKMVFLLVALSNSAFLINSKFL